MAYFSGGDDDGRIPTRFQNRNDTIVDHVQGPEEETVQGTLFGLLWIAVKAGEFVMIWTSILDVSGPLLAVQNASDLQRHSKLVKGRPRSRVSCISKRSGLPFSQLTRERLVTQVTRSAS